MHQQESVCFRTLRSCTEIACGAHEVTDRKEHPMVRQALLFVTALGLILDAAPSTAVPIVEQGSGANPAAIQGAVDAFRADLGGANNGVGGSFSSGRREINWDGTPDNFSSPNN